MKKKESVFLLTGEQWLGVAILVIIAIGTIIALRYLPHPSAPNEAWISDSAQSAWDERNALARQEAQARSKARWDSIRTARRDSIALAKAMNRARLREQITLQPFDPNTADSVLLVRVGLEPWQAHNILRYRAKGGRYRHQTDLRRLYGMTDSLYSTLEPWIVIDTIALQAKAASTTPHDTLTTTYRTSKRDTIINIRTADTTDLKKIRGIGSYRAREIVRYRESLGGFTGVEQVMELKAMQPVQADSILTHLTLDTVVVRQLAVNHLRADQMRHPYLTFTQAKAIYDMRRRMVKLKSIEDLKKTGAFSENELFRIKAYLSFED